MLANTPQELFRLFQRVKSEYDIQSLQENTVLDDRLPAVQAFIASRTMLMQLYTYNTDFSIKN
jgi:hypothetical protein